MEGMVFYIIIIKISISICIISISVSITIHVNKIVWGVQHPPIFYEEDAINLQLLLDQMSYLLFVKRK